MSSDTKVSSTEDIRSPSSFGPRVHYDVEAAAATASSRSPPISPRRPTRHSTSSEPEVYQNPRFLRSRSSRSNTVKSPKAAEAYQAKVNWHPGQEPGLDPSKRFGGRENAPTLHTRCEITVVDFSEDDMQLHHLDNETLPVFLERHGKREEWARCRWINVNGLSWDVIQALGNWKKLHRLALEDLIHTTNRTKADWYSDHVYIVMTLLKLVHMHPKDEVDLSDSESESETESRKSKKRKSRMPKFMRSYFNKHANARPASRNDPYVSNGKVIGHTSDVDHSPVQKMRSLQRYHRSPNEVRSQFLEQKSSLRANNLSVCAEQVSIFLASDNTVISFFESSAEDIENPILLRLRTQDTVLRHSCDASMIVQAIIDAIVDLAIPVTMAYQDVLGDLELDVLTSPEISHATRLYILTSEISLARAIVNPISGLISSLRDHKEYNAPGTRSLGISFSPLTTAYFGDVDDHVAIIGHSLDQMTNTTNSLIDLIFNSVAAYQNDSLKQLTIITIIFLPLSFLTGYFGMNFEKFSSLDHNEAYFWSIAIPVAVVTTLFLMREGLFRYVIKTVQRRGISRSRKGKLTRQKQKLRDENIQDRLT